MNIAALRSLAQPWRWTEFGAPRKWSSDYLLGVSLRAGSVAARNPDGSHSERKFPLPRSLANVKRGFAEQKREDAKSWVRK